LVDVILPPRGIEILLKAHIVLREYDIDVAVEEIRYLIPVLYFQLARLSFPREETGEKASVNIEI
jgi:hypothetical protein